MIREALRRVLWLAPTLAFITITAFWLISRSVGRDHGDERDLPLFVNPDPKGVQARCLAAADAVAAGGTGAEHAASELARIGGAALPYLVPHLDALAPEGRIRVALALAPVARRMRVGKHEEYARRETAVLFWTRFWQDRAIDFRPIVVKRAVRRVMERPSPLRRAEVLAFDTFALSEIMDSMAALGAERDRAQIDVLSNLAADITGDGWRLAPGASPEDARSNVSKWQRWWAAERKWFVPFQGIPRLTAMLRETRYGRWAGQLARGGLGSFDERRSVVDVLVQGARITLPLVLFGLLGGYASGIAAGTIAAARRRETDLLLTAVALFAIAIPVATFAWWLSRTSGAAMAKALMAAVTGVFVFFQQRAAQFDEVTRDWVRTERAYGIPAHRTVVHLLRSASVPVASRLGSDLPLVLTTAFVVEEAFSMPGLGTTTVAAVHDGNVAWLMVLTLSTASFVGLFQILSDIAIRLIDRRILGGAADHGARVR